MPGGILATSLSFFSIRRTKTFCRTNQEPLCMITLAAGFVWPAGHQHRHHPSVPSSIRMFGCPSGNEKFHVPTRRWAYLCSADCGALCCDWAFAVGCKVPFARKRAVMIMRELARIGSSLTKSRAHYCSLTLWSLFDYETVQYFVNTISRFHPHPKTNRPEARDLPGGDDWIRRMVTPAQT